MIGLLKGTVVDKEEDHLILDVHGVGYRVFTLTQTLASLALQEAALLYIETYVREDSLRLFGFETKQQRQWFCLLQTVQGIGTKVSLALLNSLSVSELSSALQKGDLTTLCRAPGIGKRGAERLFTELKGKVPVYGNAENSLKKVPYEVSCASARGQIANDVIAGLVHLGYKAEHATKIVESLLQNASPDEPIETDMLLRLALRQLAR